MGASLTARELVRRNGGFTFIQVTTARSFSTTPQCWSRELPPPEQPRRLLPAELDESCLEEWGGQVVVENHVNVLRKVEPKSPLTARLLVALLASDALDRLCRCLTGSVAVSAYELAAIPLPEPSTLLT